MAQMAARQKYLENLANNLMQTVRNLQVNLLMADSASAQELSPRLKQYLYDELIKAAGLVEVRDVPNR
jgi:hypothetical protein